MLFGLVGRYHVSKHCTHSCMRISQTNDILGILWIQLIERVDLVNHLLGLLFGLLDTTGLCVCLSVVQYGKCGGQAKCGQSLGN